MGLFGPSPFLGCDGCFFLFPGKAHGYGTYFATDASYSIRHAALAFGIHNTCILQCRAVVGKYTKGSQRMKTLPVRFGTTDQYDSAVDNRRNPTAYILFNDTAAYPEYLIKF